MILTEVQIINYKSCTNVLINLEKDNPNILIGINDSGKSTILNAIGLLLDDKIKFNFIQDDKARNDISNVPIENDDFLKIFAEFDIPPLTYSKQVCYVVGKFKLEQNSLNDEISMHLQWVLQDNAVEDIWLCRKFDNITKVSSHLILTPLGIKDNFEYFKEKPTALSKIVKEKKIEKVENKNRVGRFSGLELLQSIMDNLELQNSWCEYKIDKNVFPQYRYIDWNISMEQLSQFTKDTMQEQIKIELEEA